MASDLAIAVAVAASYYNVAVPRDLAVCGEVRRAAVAAAAVAAETAAVVVSAVAVKGARVMRLLGLSHSPQPAFHLGLQVRCLPCQLYWNRPTAHAPTHPRARSPPHTHPHTPGGPGRPCALLLPAAGRARARGRQAGLQARRHPAGESGCEGWSVRCGRACGCVGACVRACGGGGVCVCMYVCVCVCVCVRARTGWSQDCAAAGAGQAVGP